MLWTSDAEGCGKKSWERRMIWEFWEHPFLQVPQFLRLFPHPVKLRFNVCHAKNTEVQLRQTPGTTAIIGLLVKRKDVGSCVSPIVYFPGDTLCCLREQWPFDPFPSPLPPPRSQRRRLPQPQDQDLSGISSDNLSGHLFREIYLGIKRSWCMKHQHT